MASFDRRLWDDRASFRLERELALSVPEGRAYAKFYDDLQSNASIEDLIGWLRRRRIDVSFVNEPKGGLWLREQKTIRINARSRSREQYHTLLHECGHHLVDLSAANHTDGKYAEGYERVYDLKDPAQKRINVSFRHRIDVIAEEIDAWHAGRKLARRLNLYLNDEAYNKSRAQSLKTYVKWSLERTADKPDDDEEKDDGERRGRQPAHAHPGAAVCRVIRARHPADNAVRRR